MNEAFLIKRAVAQAHMASGRAVKFDDRPGTIEFDFRGELDKWLVGNPDAVPRDAATGQALCGPELCAQSEPAVAEPEKAPFVPPAGATPGEIAAAFLQHVLADGPMPANAAENQALSVGIRPRTLARAKAALGVRSQKVGDRWQWSLPEPALLPVG